MESDFQGDIDIIGQIAAVPKILEVVCRTTGMGFAAVARVTNDRWIACKVLDNIDFGLRAGDELQVETTLCQIVRDNRAPVIINHVDEDEDFWAHQTPKIYGFQSYISVPIILADGKLFGTLCAIDPRPALIDKPEVISIFTLFAELIAVQIDAQQKIIRSEKILLDEREVSELREQFIAVLGHDLRNPLSAIDAGINLLLRGLLDDKSLSILKLMKGSTMRMRELIENVLDFARGRLGGGFLLQRENQPLEPVLRQVIEEVRFIWENHQIDASFNLAKNAAVDPARIAQLFSNLLANAVIHGAPGTPIRVEATSDDREFKLAVINKGKPIPSEILQRLFQPFYRGSASVRVQGLGIGLFIASEIARAHGGELQVMSTSDETRFMFVMAA